MSEQQRMSSPRPWGCFPDNPQLKTLIAVFPTPVGVFPVRSGRQKDRKGLPHARGGVSGRQRAKRSGGRSSPRPWGCFL